MFCSISGNVPEQPVVSKKSGNVFEKRLVEKYIQETGKCPVTGEALSLDDLLSVSNSKHVKPRTAPATSIPGLLGLFHDEWDALMLENHTLRQSLNTTRQELCHALYQHDAACRVIARLIRERDEARTALESVKETMRADASKRAAEPAEPAADGADAKRAKKVGIPEEVLQELQEVNQTLSKGRKKRQIPEGLATVEELAGATLLGSFPLHKTAQGGINSIDIHPEKDTVVATAGMDGTVQIYDYAANRTLGSLEGHTKRLTSAAYLSAGAILTSSADKTARVWTGEGGSYSCQGVLSDHNAEVVAVTPHPSRKYFVTAGADGSWCFYDLEKLSCLRKVQDEAAAEAFTCASFHPDGLILGTGTDKNVVRIWEVKAQKNVATFEGHTKGLRGLAFSENGYHMATAADDCVKLWDLRKLKNFKTLVPYEDFPCTNVAFDYSGQYLAVAGQDARILNQKADWDVVKTFPDMPKRGVLSVRFGTNARTLLVGSSDHNLRVFTVGSTEAAAMQE